MMKVRGMPKLKRTIAGAALSVSLIFSMSCVRPEDSGVQVIVGARLEAGPASPSVEHSVVVVSGGKFQAVGPQSSTPVPIGAKMTSGLGLTIQPIPGGDPIEPGRPANLVLKGGAAAAGERIMRDGAWVQRTVSDEP
jgi:hypothetical protein